MNLAAYPAKWFLFSLMLIKHDDEFMLLLFKLQPCPENPLEWCLLCLVMTIWCCMMYSPAMLWYILLVWFSFVHVDFEPWSWIECMLFLLNPAIPRISTIKCLFGWCYLMLTMPCCCVIGLVWCLFEDWTCLYDAWLLEILGLVLENSEKIEAHWLFVALLLFHWRRANQDISWGALKRCRFN